MTNDSVDAETRDRLAALREENTRLAAEVTRLRNLLALAAEVIETGGAAEQYELARKLQAECGKDGTR